MGHATRPIGPIFFIEGIHDGIGDLHVFGVFAVPAVIPQQVDSLPMGEFDRSQGFFFHILKRLKVAQRVQDETKILRIGRGEKGGIFGSALI